MGWDCVQIVLRPQFGLFYQPQMIDDGDCGAFGGMLIGRGNRSTRRKPAPSATLSTTNPTWPDWAWTWAAAVGSRRLTPWAMVRPSWNNWSRTYIYGTEGLLSRSERSVIVLCFLPVKSIFTFQYQNFQDPFRHCPPLCQSDVFPWGLSSGICRPIMW
jgi:hypothetical protein